MRIATWNIGSALEGDWSQEVEYIAEVIERNSVDILCLQEVLTAGCQYDFIKELQERLAFEYCAIYTLSSAHIDDHAQSGIAIISRYEIEENYQVKLTNPKLEYKKNNGTVIYSDDKGFLVVGIRYKGEIVKVITGHMLPYHSFGSDSKDHKDAYEEMYSRVCSYCNNEPIIICGDFNTSKLDYVLPQYRLRFENAFSKPTRPNGNQNDYILVSGEWNYKEARLERTKYDHYFCVLEVYLKSTDDLSVLQLSDIHFMSKDYEIDQKSTLQDVNEHDIRRTTFINRLSKLETPIDYVIVSGDITTAGNTEGFEQFNNLVLDMQNKHIFPGNNHFVIVPGNHDVGNGKRWNNFTSLLGGNFVRPWISECDKSPYELLGYIENAFFTNTWTIRGYIESGINRERVHLPFVLDTEKHVLIYAFNSASISQTKVQLNKSDMEFISKLKAKKMSKDMARVLGILETELQVDPARIDPTELFLFGEILKLLDKKIDLSIYYKIAVFHHHITNINCTEEIKKFDEITNAGKFKQLLGEKRFQMIMHGHKHSPDIFFDTAVAGHKRFLVSSGGTIFGYPNGTDRGFYFHQVRKNIVKSKFVNLTNAENDFDIISKLSGDTDLKNGLTLAQIYENIETVVVQHINKETINGKEYTGWSKNIVEQRVGSISTVYGLLILELLGGDSGYYLSKKENLIQSLWNFRHENGGWGAVSQITKTGAPEATAWVTLALYYTKSPLYKEALADLNAILDQMDEIINSNFTIALVIMILCKVDSKNERIPKYCEKLYSSAITQQGKIKFWCAKSRADLIYSIEPSAVHTAISVLALYEAQSVRAISKNLESDLGDTRNVLLNREFWKNTREGISIQMGDKEDSLNVDYYTIAWILKALLHMENFVDNDTIQELVDLLLQDYEDGYWRYDQTKPIWAIYDGVTALQEYLLTK